jgi:hypothetical protein
MHLHHITSYEPPTALVPIIKYKLGNISSSKNYRSIAIISLILKIFKWIVILLIGEIFGLDDLPFSYQAALLCSDKTKAFDLVKHSLLFQKLLQQKLSRIFLRLLIVMYIHQNARVRWLSELFGLKNGCKQGAVLSGILYNFYLNGFFQRLRDLKSGCWIDLHYVGYADDDWLLAPSRNAS